MLCQIDIGRDSEEYEMKAFVFPGQGVQHVGMGKREWEASGQIRALFDRAEPQIGPRLREIMFNGPADELDKTINAQPAIFLASYARFLMLNERCDVTVGHSLGEYTALVAAGALSFTDALGLVIRRARYMQEVCDAGPKGAMAAIRGIDEFDAARMCFVAKNQFGKTVVPANINAPWEIVISGDETAVQYVVDWVRPWATQITHLRVAGAFHSPLMEPARVRLASDLSALRALNPLSIPVYSSITAERFGSTEDIRSTLMRQLTARVRWHDTIENIVRDGAITFVDIGPRHVLYRLISSSFPNIISMIPRFPWEPNRQR